MSFVRKPITSSALFAECSSPGHFRSIAVRPPIGFPNNHDQSGQDFLPSRRSTRELTGRKSDMEGAHCSGRSNGPIRVDNSHVNPPMVGLRLVFLPDPAQFCPNKRIIAPGRGSSKSASASKTCHLSVGLFGRQFLLERAGSEQAFAVGDGCCPFNCGGLLLSRRQSHLPSCLVSSTRGPEIVKFLPSVIRGNWAGPADGGSSTNRDTPPGEGGFPAGPCGGR